MASPASSVCSKSSETTDDAYEGLNVAIGDKQQLQKQHSAKAEAPAEPEPTPKRTRDRRTITDHFKKDLSTFITGEMFDNVKLVQDELQLLPGGPFQQMILDRFPTMKDMIIRNWSVYNKMIRSRLTQKRNNVRMAMGVAVQAAFRDGTLPSLDDILMMRSNEKVANIFFGSFLPTIHGKNRYKHDASRDVISVAISESTEVYAYMVLLNDYDKWVKEAKQSKFGVTASHASRWSNAGVNHPWEVQAVPKFKEIEKKVRADRASARGKAFEIKFLETVMRDSALKMRRKSKRNMDEAALTDPEMWIGGLIPVKAKQKKADGESA
mmetsp:Transcript_24122/g.67967  ORF Transcript_24122/g.67967 Transcript_24122/m.67967 type:complete len:324 (+) Transcript_24122:93-1064(+)|eukprot:CAMPEP_0119553710 /NCGR_PEP_ID=MMETSP1352-20130426/6397_1 /TAXON_ID=265584 /ORGANISM="Stauroneis constricta, Strain CCMP1120" /LENGTH=323 /DNA_ID=CAMNT_0007600167 /DNA_START=13 /DNA_END=984 /DNA_ORIENTATION=-